MNFSLRVYVYIYVHMRIAPPCVFLFPQVIFPSQNRVLEISSSCAFCDLETRIIFAVFLQILFENCMYELFGNVKALIRYN